ncbi:cytochrome-c peroxidase [Patiriisocius marinistellae]|uniref:Cytochrome-c peroxidase n=1 Tax=Patiriisocius marinistellae TaxID=2494560 RepID=A0A5J4FUB0_9FLAO|nr:cytochrome c peroxidase [Patiriisocius marinistellae]GEQ84542.1 cytochrome-c peroxidase [Patiriisocius marinistellae]
MFKLNPVLIVLITICTASLFVNCIPRSSSYSKKPLTIKDFYNDAENKIEALNSVAAAFQRDNVSADSLQRTLTNARNAYKKIEIYIAYLYPKYANTRLNGAPLLKTKKSGNQPTVVPPEGLQVLDELIYADNPSLDKVKIAALTKKLKANYNSIAQTLKRSKPSTKILISASRMQLVRIFTLSITGFDTPGSANGLEEASISLQSINQLIGQSTIISRRNKSEINNIITRAIAQINENNSFDNFDRLKFLTQSIDPLYKLLGNISEEKSKGSIKKATAWNPNSKSIFATNFLNPYFFTQLNEEEDSPALRQLGEALFYDTSLSNNKEMSCATCHKPELAFTDGLKTSMSNIDGKNVLRNSPTLLNAVYAERFFYDVRAFNLEQQAEHVIFNSDEFDTDYSQLLASLNNMPSYKDTFKKAFDTPTVSRQKIASALASYVLSLQSFNSPFDKYVRGEIDQIGDDVKNGFNIFMGKGACATCHFAPTFSGLVPPLFIDSETEILGVLENPDATTPIIDTDEGRWKNGINAEAAWIYEKSFKTTTVRNIDLTAPYFHNGAYNTLEQVLDFYNKGGGAGMGLNVVNQTLPDAPLALSEKEISDVISFLKSLTDISVIK